MLTRAEDHSDGRRAREVYRYFRPERLCPIDENPTLSRKIGSDQDLLRVPDVPTTRGRSPCSGSQSSNPPQASTEPVAKSLKPMPESLILGDANTTLNSFAQLVALRLDVDRAFISVSDRDSQYIIAQGGQTLEGTNKYDLIGEGLYAGCSTLEVSDWNMCQDTVALPPSDREQADYSFLISNDMTQDERYKHLPLVNKQPNFRFYAGTPLTTDSNINVGCLFVLDTKPHAEFSGKESETMAHMAVLIMDFLKVSRQASEGRRAARQLRGINNFVEGRSSFETDADNVGKPCRQSSNASLSRKPSHHRRNNSSSSFCSRSSSSSAHSASDSEPYELSSSSSHGSINSDELDKIQTSVESKLGNSWTFRRAANLIRESLELGDDSGVAFLEAGSDSAPERSSDSDFSGCFETGKSSSVLGLSTAEDLYGPSESSTASNPVTTMDEDFLQRLLNTYQKGKIWSLHRDGQLSSSDSEDGSPKRSTSTKPHSRSKPPQGSKGWKLKENKMLNQYFPGATQVMFVPLWSAANSQWFGGCFCWNNVESNVLDPSVELTSLLSFGSSIMSECSRVESLISDRQKADFIGSISHELRSPLHGVLAAAEILQSTGLNQYQGSLMDTVNACGRTLLDTMNQVLDYSKIVSLEKRFRHLDRRRLSTLELKNMHRSAAHLDKYATTDLSLLAEEVVDGVCLGHHHIQKLSSSSQVLTSIEPKQGTAGTGPQAQKVDIIIDISPNDWVYNIPPGAIRRIIMNIFSNAIKYTEAGHVSLRLEADSSLSRHGTQEDIVTLTVTDTGKGISEEFLRSRLFVPFIQEDSLASGSGLGLSIVRSLLKPLGGSINFQSKPGSGTTAKVTIPLARSGQEFDAHFVNSRSPTPEQASVPLDAYLLRQNYSGRTVAIVNSNFEDASDNQSWAVASRYLTDWYGLNVVSPSSKRSIDLILLNELPPEIDFNSKFPCDDAALLIMNNDYIGQDSIQIMTSSGARNINVINRACGPHKLAGIVKRCLDRVPPDATVMPISISEQASPPTQNDCQKTEIPNLETGKNNADTVSSGIPSKSELTQQPSESLPPGENAGARILVVEDNKINLNLMLAFLKKRNLAALHSAENGNLALSAVKDEQQSYDIIFMDISMPVMNGFDAARMIRTFEKERGDESKRSKIIALTGLSSVSDETEALDCGMDMFLTKPVAFKEVKKILDRWDEGGNLDQETGLPDFA
ncbi:hypothetical protein N7466_005548 [Penicillium verhagenii]|uniref:uncharacterized protein n=1 Tax=Penicillium verhagenii TaxID=1562060 RepID=UPI002545940C|nr:uncharacterized protein N7466_005548 [Penicillium verhagenii]KAJ5930055.1 hypothetical protein N7466_005548 [Penicillium verhagenii]